MLYIATDLEKKNWLIYILEEFKRINKANFDIKVMDIDNTNDIKNENVIYYTKKFIKKTTIVNKSDVLPDKNIIKILENLFVIDGTITNNDRFICKYDIFWNSFVFLSRLEEYLSENSGKEIHSYSFNHPRFDKSTFDIPIVNNLFNEFEKIIKTNFSDLTFGEKQKLTVELSHDVDYIEKTLQLRFKQTTFNTYNALKSIYKPEKFLKNNFKMIKFLFSNPSYWCFDYWVELEKKFKKKSVFYVYAKTTKKRFKSWLMDPSYDVVKNVKLQRKLKYLIAEGFEIGLHGSFDSAMNEKLLTKEKEILESSIDYEITKIRQHWLRYKENITPYIHNNLFKFDSTLGWNNIAGFRSGCASRYRPYDHKNQKTFNFFETPQIIMDSNIFDYSADKVDEAMHNNVQMLEDLENYKTSYVSISWHQRVCSDDYGRNKIYEILVDKW